MPVMTDEESEDVKAPTDAAEQDATETDAAEPTELTDSTEAADADESPESTEAAADAGADTEAAAPAKRERRQVSLRTVGLVAIFAVLIGGCGFLGWQVWQQRQLASASSSAQAAAVSYAQVLTSIDSNKVDENFKLVLDGATGEFKDMYSQSSVQLRQLLIENKATAHGVVVESAVQSISKNKAVVLLFVDQSVSNTSLPDPRIDRSRMKMTLEKVDGSWRASKVELP